MRLACVKGAGVREVRLEGEEELGRAQLEASAAVSRRLMRIRVLQRGGCLRPLYPDISEGLLY